MTFSIYLIGPLMLAMGLYVIFLSRSRRKKAAASTGWPTVPGVVLDAELQRETRARLTPDSGARPHLSQSAYSYYPRIEYSYSLGGREYRNDKYSLEQMYMAEAAAQEVMRRFPPGAAVTVHFNPANPAESALQAGASGVAAGCSVALRAFFAGLGFLIRAAEILVVALRR